MASILFMLHYPTNSFITVLPTTEAVLCHYKCQTWNKPIFEKYHETKSSGALTVNKY